MNGSLSDVSPSAINHNEINEITFGADYGNHHQTNAYDDDRLRLIQFWNARSFWLIIYYVCVALWRCGVRCALDQTSAFNIILNVFGLDSIKLVSGRGLHFSSNGFARISKLNHCVCTVHGRFLQSKYPFRSNVVGVSHEKTEKIRRWIEHGYCVSSMKYLKNVHHARLSLEQKCCEMHVWIFSTTQCQIAQIE